MSMYFYLCTEDGACFYGPEARAVREAYKRHTDAIAVPILGSCTERAWDSRESYLKQYGFANTFTYTS